MKIAFPVVKTREIGRRYVTDYLYAGNGRTAVSSSPITERFRSEAVLFERELYLATRGLGVICAALLVLASITVLPFAGIYDIFRANYRTIVGDVRVIHDEIVALFDDLMDMIRNPA